MQSKRFSRGVCRRAQEVAIIKDVIVGGISDEIRLAAADAIASQQALLLNLFIIDETPCRDVTQPARWAGLARPQACASRKAAWWPFSTLTEAANAEPNQGCLHSVDDPTSLSDEAVMSAVGPLAILVLHCRDLDHLAVITLAVAASQERSVLSNSVSSRSI